MNDVQSTVKLQIARALRACPLNEPEVCEMVSKSSAHAIAVAIRSLLEEGSIVKTPIDREGAPFFALPGREYDWQAFAPWPGDRRDYLSLYENPLERDA